MSLSDSVAAFKQSVRCNVCEAQFTDQVSFLKHLESADHRRQVGMPTLVPRKPTLRDLRTFLTGTEGRYGDAQTKARTRVTQ
ncbi:hypothetical protein SS50377_25807 [Spironucleus salmonicida]|uniref:C2H2-type domain-containing protein n=1 Tax=Spironucleus salmonicida TaxID=348837 RepID=V6LUI0_9EUKA|nr:hypothetical protein SS50377_25799 [Spironucleus salmonicida]KAH0571618.1 hypothetical protein SS50377_25807 [Spironucleus salmonicida]|eukprot:EST48225.1 hypothetical protein SS50377_11566 [Spironucleus salmonicida]